MENREIIELIMKKVGAENPSQFALYLTKTYDKSVSRTQVHQAMQGTALTMPYMLLREALK